METEMRFKKTEDSTICRQPSFQIEAEESSCNDSQIEDAIQKNIIEGRLLREKMGENNESFSSDNDQKSWESPTGEHPSLQSHIRESLAMIRRNSAADVLAQAPKQLSKFSAISRSPVLDENLLTHLKALKVEELKDVDQIELAILILQKASEDRTSSDLTFLVKCTEEVAFFKKYDEDTHMQCLSKMYHVHLKQGEYCIKFGEYGENFWVTLKGRVGIFIPKEIEVKGKNGKSRRSKVLTRIVGQGAGYAFGELALLERKPRAATIICEEDCDFAVLDKAPFQQILHEKEEKRLFAEINFLKSLKLFTHWAYNSIRSLFMYVELKTYTRNQIVYSQSDLAEHMYFIREGEFKVTVRANYEDQETNSDEAAFERFRRKKSPTRGIEVSILGPREICGVEEMLAGKKYSYAIACMTQTGIAVKINKRNATALIFSEATAKAWLNEYLVTKAQIQAERIANIYNNTKKYKTLLMCTNSVTQKPSEMNSRRDSVDLESKPFATARNSQYTVPAYPNGQTKQQKPEEIFHKRIIAAEEVAKKCYQKYTREISGKRWTDERWLIKKSLAAKELSDSLKDEEPPISKYVYCTGKEVEKNTIKSNLTSRLLREYKERSRFRPKVTENARSKSLPNSPDKASTVRASIDAKSSQQVFAANGEFTKTVSKLIDNQKANGIRKITKIPSSPILVSKKPDQSFQAHVKSVAKLQQSTLSKQIPSQPLKNNSTIPLDFDDMNREMLLKPIYPETTMDQIQTLSKIRDRIDQNTLILSKRKEQQTGMGRQVFYNSTISNMSGWFTPRKYSGANTPLKLLIREHTEQKKEPTKTPQRVIRTEFQIEGELTHRIGLATTRSSSWSNYPSNRTQSPKIIGLKNSGYYNQSPHRLRAEAVTPRIMVKNTKNY